MTTNVIEFGRIYKEDLAQGDSPETVILADGRPMLMHPLLDVNGKIDSDDIRERGFIDPVSKGADPTGTSDSYSAIQAAIDECYANHIACIFDHSGSYKVLQTLNLANKRGLVVLGRHAHDLTGPILLGHTGAGKPIIDACGAHGLRLEGFALRGVTSTIGIQLGYTTVDDNIGGQLRNLYIEMPSARTANGNAGTIGILSKSAENMAYEHLIVKANLPMVLTNTADLSWLRGTLACTHTVSSDYATLAPMSCGVHNFSGNNMLVALGKHRAALALYNAACINAGALYISSAASVAAGDGTYVTGIQAHSAVGLHITGGMAEYVLTALDAHYLTNSSIQMITIDGSGTLGPAINLYGGAGGGVQNSLFRVGLQGETRVLVDVDGTNALTSLVQNCEFTSDSAVAGKTLPSVALTALLGANVRFYSLADTYPA